MNVKSLPSRVVWTLGIATALGYANTSASSWIEHALTSRATPLGVQQASYVVTAELLAMAATMTFCTRFVRRFPWKAMIMVGTVMVGVTQLISAQATNFWTLITVRSLSGVLFGLLYATAISIGATSEDPQKTFAGGSSVALLVATLFNPFVGYSSEHLGPGGVFLGLAAYCGVQALVLLCIPSRPRSVSNPSTHSQLKEDTQWNVGSGLGVLLIMALMTIGANGILLFSITIAKGTGLEGTALGSGLAVVSLLSAGGGLAASKIGSRFGLFPPLAAGLIVLSATLYVFSIAKTPVVFWITITLIVALFWFISPYIFGLSVLVDREGRLASMTGGTKILFSAIGSAIAGTIAAHSNIGVVGISSCAICLTAVPAAWFVLRKLSRDGESQDAPAGVVPVPSAIIPE